MKRDYLETACEEIDAAVFSGDVLTDDDPGDMEMLCEYITRWNRAISEARAALQGAKDD